MTTLQEFNRFGARLALAVALGVAVLTAGVQAHADDDHGKCQRRVERAEQRLDQAIRSHGEHSGQAESRRRALNAERERCWSSYHGWWNGSDHRWHTERDWDHDHDHDDHR